MQLKWLILCVAIAALSMSGRALADTAAVKQEQEPKQLKDKKGAEELTKDKRQIDQKDTAIYPNHRHDDPEEPQETIYGRKPSNQFLIRPVSPHQQAQHDDDRTVQAPQLRNYPVTIRPHSTQLLEQSQEIQHFAYLQDLSRNHAKTGAVGQLSGKTHNAYTKKQPVAARGSTNAQAQQPIQYEGGAEEAEQRYAVSLSAQQQHLRHSYQLPYHLAVKQHEQQHEQQQSQQHPHPQIAEPTQAAQAPYKIIPEEQFLRLIEEELQARAYHEAQLRQHGAVQPETKEQATERANPGLGNYRQRQSEEPPIPEFIQYVPRHRGGPKYLPFQHQQQQPQQQQHRQHQARLTQQSIDIEQQQADLPPQIAYYQPQISYKTLPNHPLAKSSLEKEIEKLLAANKPSPADNSNEPTALINHRHQSQIGTRAPHPKVYVASTTPTSLLDANNQPFVPSLFRFSPFQTPTPIYPTVSQVSAQEVEAKKLGPVVYPTQPSTVQPAQPSQYYYQEATPSPTSKPKLYRSKQYGNKIAATAATASMKSREKDIKYATVNGPATPKYSYDYERQSQLRIHNQQQRQQQQLEQEKFYPSQPDPSGVLGTAATPTHTAPFRSDQPDHAGQSSQSAQPGKPGQLGSNYRSQYALPPSSPSQSSIFVSQGTGIAPIPVQTTHKPKTVEDVKQLHLPQPGGKPLTQAEFQALVEAGYPITAVPVPVPVPFEQYIKDHPEYSAQVPPTDFGAPLRFSTQGHPHSQPHYSLGHQRSFGVASEPSVKIISGPSEEPQRRQPQSQQIATGIGGGSITYLRPIAAQQKRRPRDENETKVAGAEKVIDKKN